ncbi:hypothetical protein TELCIR_13169 [Teladorsagia circumcincta]|uniref:V-type proton ATPase subunit a n=1 Tax=Teladorsagia circumcincta TaxID=45464 RepID=A0A2G9U4S2_TELCI|nr:hypothetical protein TELCIR_13169 [Teladorsagia circumcincta]
MKWIFFYVKPAFIFGRLYPGPFCAPSLLIGLINMFMLKARDPGFVQNIGSVNATDSVVIDGKNYTYTMYDQCYLQQWYPGQVLTEQVLLLLAVVSIPIMLLVKPFYVRSLAKRGLPIPGGHGHSDDEDEEVCQQSARPICYKMSDYKIPQFPSSIVRNLERGFTSGRVGYPIALVTTIN